MIIRGVSEIGFGMYWVVFWCFVVGKKFGWKYVECLLLWFVNDGGVVVLLWVDVGDGVKWWFVGIIGRTVGGWV